MVQVSAKFGLKDRVYLTDIGIQILKSKVFLVMMDGLILEILDTYKTMVTSL